MFSTIVELASKEGYTHKKLLPWSARRAYHAQDHLVLDPLFWQAITKAIGYRLDDRHCSCNGYSYQCDCDFYWQSFASDYFWIVIHNDKPNLEINKFWKELLPKKSI